MSNKPKIKSITYVSKTLAVEYRTGVRFMGAWVPVSADDLDTLGKREIIGFSADDYPEGAKIHVTAFLDLSDVEKARGVPGE